MINGNNLLSHIIYEEGNGYILYEKYRITKGDGEYLAERFTDGGVKSFSKLRWAATWCILDRYNKIIESKRVLELSLLIESANAEILLHHRLKKSANAELREISKSKYFSTVDKQKRFQWELDKYIILAKKCQERGYQNELTRIAGK